MVLAVGVAFIVVYSTVMMTSEGSASWAWVLLFAGVAVLGGSEWWRRRTPES